MHLQFMVPGSWRMCLIGAEARASLRLLPSVHASSDWESDGDYVFTCVSTRPGSSPSSVVKNEGLVFDTLVVPDGRVLIAI